MDGPDASVRCVRCGEPLAGVTSDYCPRCGMPVSASLGGGQLPQAAAAPEPAGSGGVPPAGAGGYEAPLFPPAPPPTAAPYPSYPSYPSYPQYPPAEQPQQPSTYPPYPSYPYGQPTAPSTPLYPPTGYPTGYPQFAPPSVPLSGQYGQPAGPSVPYYGQPAGPSVPYYGPPGMPAPWTVPLAPAKKRRTGLIVGLLVALLVVVAGGGTAAVLTLSHGGAGANGTPIPTNTTGPTATPTPRIAFQDPLTSNTNGWANDSHCFFGSGGYHVKDGYGCYAPAGQYADADVSVQVSQISGPLNWYYGILFRRESQGNSYGFGITSDGSWKVWKHVNGKLTELNADTPSTAIHVGLNALNAVRIRAVGTHFDFFVNGVHVGSLDDTTFTAAGFWGVLGGGGGIEVVFTRFALATTE